MKKINSFARAVSVPIVSGVAVILFFAGVIRDDVPEARYTALAVQKQFDCVGRVFNNGRSSGSCVLIGKRYVLSAAHIFTAETYKMDTVIMNGQKVAVNLAGEPGAVDITQYSFLFAGKTYKGRSLKTCHILTDSKESPDLAIVELEGDVSSVSPATISMSSDELGANITGVGYGASGLGGQPKTVSSIGKKIAGENTVDSLGGPKVDGKATLMLCDFDCPTDPSLNRTGSPVPLPLEYICNGGDSGGGMFRKTGNTWQLIGICKGIQLNMEKLLKNGYYGQLMKWTRVGIFNTWIKKETQS